MDIIHNACQYSPYLSHHLQANNLNLDLLSSWLTRAISDDDFQQFAPWQQLQHDENEEELAKQLRILRRHVMAHIMIRDLNHISDLAEVTDTITRFADFAVNIALNFAYQYYQGLYGTPIGRNTQTQQYLSVVAMGKAGGYELNVSSDIDLIFVFQESGETNGKRERSNQEFFTKVGQKLIALLNDITADGQVFRVDMRLRPDGDSGALVISETALEQYLIQHGREWERYAWCKGRIITPYPNDITALVRPFVFRKYLDFNAYEAMRDLHRQIRAEVSKKGMENNIKLGAGGIREVEFIAQIFQMIRGGQNRSLQLKGTQETLNKLAEVGILNQQESECLLNAYHFLRQVEHRLQYWNDSQTQTLPEDPQQQLKLAQSMEFASYPQFADGLQQHRQAVNQIFNNILSEPEDNDSQEYSLAETVWNNLTSEETPTLLQQMSYDATQVLPRLKQLRQSSRYRQLSAHAAQRFDALVPKMIEAASQCQQTENTLFRLLNFLETISRRSAYLAFLQEYPNELQRLANLMSQSSWIAEYLQNHPILLDELLSDQLTTGTFDWEKLEEELAQTLDACEDTESKMDALRHFQHAQVFRLAVQDLAGKWRHVEDLSDQLSFLADTILRQTLKHAWQEMPKKHTEHPQFAIIGYGKLGGKELGYTSDLDLVFLFQDDHPDAVEVYARLVRRITTWLSGNTGAGNLYDIDLRLRPNGDAGFIVHSMAAFEKYQNEQAWTWEHQSLTRARFICGADGMEQAFENIRQNILTQHREQHTLQQDIIHMREKMFATHPADNHNVKYARGGVVDLEFIVQYIILSQSHACPALLHNYGNIALLRMAAEHGLISADTARAARAAYRYYRKQQHNEKIRDAKTLTINEQLLQHYQAVKTLWQEVFQQAVTYHLFPVRHSSAPLELEVTNEQRATK